MRYFIPAFLLASPALAHPASLPHAHSTGWALPAAFVLIGVAGIAAKRRAIRVRTRK